MQNKETVIAVSERSSLSPNETDKTFLLLVINSCSESENPPSGPINTAHLFSSSLKDVNKSIIDLFSLIFSSQ